MMRKILYIEACNFVDFPLGGTLSFAKQMIRHIPEHFYLVGFGGDRDPIGKWFKKEINNRLIDYYAIGTTRELELSKVPKRFVSYRMLKRHLSNIYKTKENVNLVFSQTPQFVFLISKYEWKKFCFCFAGIGNSVASSRFKTLRILGTIYERRLFKALKRNCDVILAAADRKTVREKALLYNMDPVRIKFFPTRYDENIFYPMDQRIARKKLKISNEPILLVTTGRLSKIKGWKDLIDSFRIFNEEHPNSKLIFVGDGEDRWKISEYGKDEIDKGTIELVGRKMPDTVSQYLSAANIYVMFSFMEGWPTAMVEALACGKNIVTTNVSGATWMVKGEKNGFVLHGRNPKDFSDAMEKAINLPNPNPISLELAEQFSAEKLYSDFIKHIQ